MHQYLDGDLSKEEEQTLKMHLQTCPACQTYFQELNRTEALIRSVPIMHAPDGFTSNILARLPKEKSRIGIQRWFKNHPFLIAAALFLLLMGGSLANMWNDEQRFSYTKQPNLIVENDTVIVPEGEVVKGDVIVENGNIKIEGKVEGNVTVINGKKYLASAGSVTGDIEEIDKMFEWIWYKLKDSGKKIVDIVGEKE
jgi:anti-sigma factor RsiW